MSYHQHREEFIARIATAMPDASAYYAASVARRLMRHASTLQRLAVAQCNGDWPADNGERKTKECPLCGSSWVPSAITGGKLARAAVQDAGIPTVGGGNHMYLSKGVSPRPVAACPDCRTAAAVRATVREHLPMFQPVFTGDPRGYVVRLAPAEATHEDIDTGRAPIVYVPGRG